MQLMIRVCHFNPVTAELAWEHGTEKFSSSIFQSIQITQDDYSLLSFPQDVMSLAISDHNQHSGSSKRKHKYKNELSTIQLRVAATSITWRTYSAISNFREHLKNVFAFLFSRRSLHNKLRQLSSCDVNWTMRKTKQSHARNRCTNVKQSLNLRLCQKNHPSSVRDYGDTVASPESRTTIQMSLLTFSRAMLKLRGLLRQGGTAPRFSVSNMIAGVVICPQIGCNAQDTVITSQVANYWPCSLFTDA